MGIGFRWFHRRHCVEIRCKDNHLFAKRNDDFKFFLIKDKKKSCKHVATLIFCNVNTYYSLSFCIKSTILGLLRKSSGARP